MKKYSLNDMTRGWFIGNFYPSVLTTNDCEVAIKEYKKGEYEKKHYHKIATEITVIIDGKVKMFDSFFEKGDIIVVEPGDATDFEAITDSRNIVVKIPGVNNDKYLMEEK